MAKVKYAKSGMYDEILYNRNHCCTSFNITVNVLVGLALAALEISQLIYLWSLNFLKFRTEQYSLFYESAPGVWLGFLFVVTAIFGIVARATQNDAERRHVRYSIYATLCLINGLASAMMVGYVGYSLDRMRWDYPYICKGYPYNGTYDHICDYEEGFYIVIGILVPMMILYCLQTVNSVFGCLYGFRKVCNTKTPKTILLNSNGHQYINVPVKK